MINNLFAGNKILPLILFTTNICEERNKMSPTNSIDNRSKGIKVSVVIDFSINDCHFDSIFNSFDKYRILFTFQ